MEKINLNTLTDGSTNHSNGVDPRNVATKSNSSEAKPSVSNFFPSTKIESANRSETLEEFSKQSQENLKQAVKEINDELVAKQSELGFSIDSVTDQSVVTVKRRDSGEVVRQIPSESFLKVAHSLEQLKGLLFDEFF